ncbi:hypothetical protein ACKLNO_00555 [Neisseriaceae bacterium B1]
MGWHNQTYILPNGDTLAPKDNENSSRIHYNGDTSQANAYTL